MPMTLRSDCFMILSPGRPRLRDKSMGEQFQAFLAIKTPKTMSTV
jgi:hypothetical protein